jgi:hypothetical protein
MPKTPVASLALATSFALIFPFSPRNTATDEAEDEHFSISLLLPLISARIKREWLTLPELLRIALNQEASLCEAVQLGPESRVGDNIVVVLGGGSVDGGDLGRVDGHGGLLGGRGHREGEGGDSRRGRRIGWRDLGRDGGRGGGTGMGLTGSSLKALVRDGGSGRGRSSR